MQYQAARAIVTRAVVAAGTASAIATVCWLLNRILDGSQREGIEDAHAYLDTTGGYSDDERDGDYSDQEQERVDTDDSFALLPVVSESDDESDEDALGYTADYFTPHYDVCVLSVSVQTLVDPLSHVPAVDSSDCRLCRAAAAPPESCDAARDGADLVGAKLRALSFSETDSSSNGSVFSIASECDDELDDEKPVQRSRTEQWLYVRL
ncbi:hypothetical protein PHYPSEUDO_009249 [Phytophthora pseudosyringae]|uniref:Uncharacterized protein n=1 Tax=Phytophthora pseudosyringae TaxID=221518 RepID=A0A8T1VD22_9STRA|nr:hypothetical protein PHYPSEUDO_009249 [Phytophthora pseudosyringae]